MGAQHTGRGWAAGVFISGVQQYGVWAHRPEYDAPIGEPLTSTFRTLANGALLRNFSHGLVLLNPKATGGELSVPLDASQRYVNARGRALLPADHASLPISSGAVLVFADS